MAAQETSALAALNNLADALKEAKEFQFEAKLKAIRDELISAVAALTKAFSEKSFDEIQRLSDEVMKLDLNLLNEMDTLIRQGAVKSTPAVRDLIRAAGNASRQLAFVKKHRL